MYANGQVIMQLKSSEKSLYKFALQPGMLPFAKAPLCPVLSQETVELG